MSDNLMNTDINPAYLLRSYAWAVLNNNMPTVWNKDNYKGMVPIVPLGEEPELSDFTGPHAVYGYAIDTSGDLHARKTGSMTFAIYDQDFRRLTKTLNILQAAFERHDESARDINAYTSLQAGYLGMTFAYTEVGFIEGGTPEDSEGGRQSALINIRFEYHVEYNVKTNITEWV